MQRLPSLHRSIPSAIGLLILTLFGAGVAWISLAAGERIIHNTEEEYAARAAAEHRLLGEYLKERRVPDRPN